MRTRLVAAFLIAGALAALALAVACAGTAAIPAVDSPSDVGNQIGPALDGTTRSRRHAQHVDPEQGS